MFLSLWLPIFLFHCRLTDAKQITLTQQSRLRNATMDDADAITTIFLAAFAPLPAWQYVYPFRNDFPGDHKKCYLRFIVPMLSDACAHTEVIEAPTGSNIALIAAAIWVQKSSHEQLGVRPCPAKDELRSRLCGLDSIVLDECMHKDMNITRAIDYERKFNAAKKTHVDDVFGTEQLYLEQLATHPDYQSRGAGTRLIESGLERGKRIGVNVTLIAEPTAENFYVHRGFREASNISLESVDGDQSFEYNVMAYD
ncbi:hypothetical protein C7974DRAFT_115820 [Boeremia exigua]|uniref:uncharacterized protein n=1 Tax=Boeremia exigua TaxID=749465 RepID=UPI001E8EC72F|nr:uncharacterized protein C7974DRAFT_115820 [Boeremia exigua]KAH6643046.1 hypothetical protein C7974DRAFT_115820 [Boeremia exigua]